MPVKLEHISKPSEEDWSDLGKIHLDTQPEGFSKPRDELEKWLTDGGWIIAARFNDRLIGAMLARSDERQCVTELSDAGVRSVTQRRGVMHQLLELIKQWAQHENRQLKISNPPKHLVEPLNRRSFINRDGSCYFSPQSYKSHTD